MKAVQALIGAMAQKECCITFKYEYSPHVLIELYGKCLSCRARALLEKLNKETP